jgi:endonuclease YncB( thermonuclease family)
MKIDGQTPGIAPQAEKLATPKEAPKIEGNSFTSAFTRALMPATSLPNPSVTASPLNQWADPGLESVPRPPGLTVSEPPSSPIASDNLTEISPPASALPAQLKGKVVGVKNGSSIEILSEGRIIAVKVYGIDCPEKNNPTGKIARHFVAVNAFMNDVAVEITGTKSDGTMVGKVTLPDGKNLGSEMLKQGIVWWDKESAPEEADMAQIEKQARDAYMGIWAGASEEEEEKDWGKEVLVKREQADKADGNLFTKVEPK